MRIGKTIASLLGTALLATASFGATAPASAKADLDKEVRHAIGTLAYYGVFDALDYTISDSGTVTLTGQVRTYPVHNSAVSAVRSIPGVTGVVDNIQVLPLSPFDDSLRIRAYNAIFGYPALSRYAITARPSIRILVNRGDITLVGVVNNELDRTLIYNRVRSVPGAFSVTNNLRLDSEVSPKS